MEYDKIKQLIEDVGNSKLESINIDFPDGTKISMKKEITSKKIIEVPKTIEKEIDIKEEYELSDTVKETLEGNIVKSPMVGTFYLKPAPDAEPYVSIGDKVKKGDTLCIIEAMKLMNEIESEFDGEIKEILVKDGESVEYGKPLFRIV